jgi:hypothetical protein
VSLLQVLQWIASRVGTILTIVGIIQGNTTKAAQENVPFEIATNAAVTRAVVDWSDVTPGPLKTALIAIEADSITHTTAILDAIALLQLAADPVILPTIPPTGYGGGSGGSTAEDIWNYQYPPASGNIMGDKVAKAGRFGEFLAQDAWFPSAYGRWVGHHFDYSNLLVDPSTSAIPVIDASTILTSDATILDWLNRTVSGFTWDDLGGLAISYDNTVISDEWWVCTMTDAEFQTLKGSAVALIANVAPVWPGVDLVTFLDPVTIDRQMKVTVACHGVIVNITAVPEKTAFFTFDTWHSYRNIGQVSFFNDDTDSESAQTLSFNSHVMTAKTMTIAAGFTCRTVGGVEGTIYPWIITV